MSKDAETEWVYVVQYRPVGAVKIGMSTDKARLVRRVTEIKAGLPTDDIDVLVVFEDEKGTERALHRVFSDANIKGEWFCVSQPGVCSLHGWLVDQLCDEHLTIEGRKIVTKSGRENLVGVDPGRPPITPGDLRQKVLGMLSGMAEESTGLVGLYAKTMILGDMSPAAVREAVERQIKNGEA
tara:strand:+ start:1024 stop:1569 length:546 start_codon:yes stop_codon:yes gene_type:complete